MLQSEGFHQGVLANFAWALLVASTALAVGVYRQDHRKFAGRWEIKIKWTHEWGNHLLGIYGTDPYSIGDASLCYGAGPQRRGYYGLAYFKLFDGTLQYSHLAVCLTSFQLDRPLFSRDFPFVAVTRIQSFDLQTLVREKLKRFTYATVAQYSIRLDHTSAERMSGRVVVTGNGQDTIVGTIEAVRVI